MTVLMLEIASAANLGAALDRALVARHIDMDRVRLRAQFLDARQRCTYDVCILDVQHGDSEMLFVELEKEASRTPAIVVLPTDNAADRIAWLDRGADDVVVRVIDVGELAARVAAAIRRARTAAAPRPLVHGALALDPQRRSATWRGNAVSVTKKEYALLERLVHGAKEVHSRDALHACLCDDDDAQRASNAVDVHVHSLRSKFHASLIRTVRGAGYRIGEAGSLPG